MKKTIIALLVTSACAMGVTLSDAVYTAKGSSLTSTSSLTGVGTGSFSLTYTVNVSKLFENDSFMIGEVFTEETKPTFVSLSDVNDRDIGTAIGTSSSINGTAPAAGESDGRTSYIRAFGIYQINGTASASGNWSSQSYNGGGTIAEVSDANMWKKDGADRIIGEDGYYVMNEDKVDDANSIIDDIVSIAVTQSHTKSTGTIMHMTLGLADGTYKELSMSGNNTSLKWSAGYDGWKTLGVNTDVVSSVYLFQGAIDKTTALALNKAATAAIPEPTTATLSLLALAGLAARRRRK